MRLQRRQKGPKASNRLNIRCDWLLTRHSWLYHRTTHHKQHDIQARAKHPTGAI